MQKAGNSASSKGYQSLFSSMKGVSSGCCLPLDQPLLTPPCVSQDSAPFVRLLRHGSLARALA
eukprot:scaffold5613_cov111-Cylindrotheca_fusiformis.AAC.1